MAKQKIKKIEFKDIQSIYKTIIDTYPFLTKNERKNYEQKVGKIINDEKFFLKNKIEFLTKIVDFLDNPHAKVFVIRNSKKGKPTPFLESEIKDRILYIKIKRWSAPNRKEAIRRGELLVNLCKKNQNKYGGIILDVRGNTGGFSVGAERFDGIFFKKDFTTSYLIRKNKKGLWKKPKLLYHDPKFNINVPIVILIDKKCFSSTELFVLPFKISKRAKIIGETTRGGSANPMRLDFLLGKEILSVRIPTWRLFIKGQNRPLEETKIKPDIYYHKNNIVKYARNYLKNRINNA